MTRHLFVLWSPSAVCFFVNGAIYGTWATQVPIAKERLAVSDAHFGLLLLAMGVGAISAMIASGSLIPRYGTARLITYGLAAFLLSAIGLAIAGTPVSFACALFAFGASGGMMDVAMNANAAEAESQIGRPVMSSIHGMWSIGGVVSSALGGAMLSVMPGPWQAATICAALLVLFLAVRSRLSSVRLSRKGEPIRGRRTLGMVWLIGGLAGLCFSAEGSVRDWSSLYFSRELVAPLSVAGWGYSAFSALMAAGRFGGDWIRSHIGERMLVTACGTVAGVGFVLTAVTSDYPIAIAGFSLVGIGLANIVPIFISVAGRSINSAASISIVVAMGYSGFLISPPILGAVAGLTSLATMFLLVGAMSMLIALAWAFIPVRPTK